MIFLVFPEPVGYVIVPLASPDSVDVGHVDSVVVQPSGELEARQVHGAFNGCWGMTWKSIEVPKKYVESIPTQKNIWSDPWF